MARRRPWLFVVAGALGVGGVVGLGVGAYWRYANEVPPYAPPRVALPAPNAYYDYCVAGAMSQAVGGAAVLAASAGRPSAAGGVPRPLLDRSGRTVEGYEDGATLAQMRAVVARNGPALARLRQGFRKRYLNPPALSFQQRFPELATFRELARVLLTEGKLAEREGRMAEAAGSYLDCLRLGVDVPRGGPLIHGLVGLAIQSMGMSAMEDLVDWLNVPTAAQAADEMLRLDRKAPTASEVLANEKELSTAAIAELMRAGKSWPGVYALVSGGAETEPTAGALLTALRFSFTPKRQIVASYRAYLDGVISDARKPYYARMGLPLLPRDVLNRTLLPVFSQATLRWDVRDALWRILEVRLVSRAYEVEHGGPPPSLGALVPGYLPAAPRDPFANQPLVYRLKAGRPLIYSRGPDGKDDGGLDLGSRASPGTVGDIVTVKGRPKRFGRAPAG